MMGPSHRIAGAAGYVAALPLLPIHGVIHIGLGLLAATATAHGRLSPDADQYRPLRGHIRHRGVTHWWVWPALLIIISLRQPVWGWLGLAVAVGWGSHVLTDAVFGRVPVMPRIRGWACCGLRLRTGGPVENFVAVPAFIGYLIWATAAHI